MLAGLCKPQVLQLLLSGEMVVAQDGPQTAKGPSLLPFGGVLKTLGRPPGCSLGENKERVSRLK